MTITPTISLATVVAIAFAVYACCLIKLAPILREVVAAKRTKLPEVHIQGQVWKVNRRLLALTTVPFVVYACCVLIYVWIIYRII